jgi:dTDP-4-dehydrorhamnose reductase
MSEATILVLGGSGQLGTELRAALPRLGTVVAPTRAELDLGDADAVRQAVRGVRPSVVVNAAAYTAVDRAESEIALASALNAHLPQVLAEESARAGALMVHYSTDYVFDGSLRRPYTEVDHPSPLNVYGQTKLEGERGAASAGGRYLILRTSWIFGASGHNFLLTMLRLAREREELRVVSDQFGTPTWSRRIADITTTLVETMRDPAAAEASGVYHLSSGGITTWYDFARSILTRDPEYAEQKCRRIVPISTAEFPTAARRPAYSVLDNARLRQQFGLVVPEWESELAEVISAMRGHDGA